MFLVYNDAVNYRGLLEEGLVKKTGGFELIFEYESLGSQNIERKATLTVVANFIDTLKIVHEQFEGEQWYRKKKDADRSACYVAWKHYSDNGWTFGCLQPNTVASKKSDWLIS